MSTETTLDQLIEETWNAGRVGVVELSGAEAIALAEAVMRLRGTLGAVSMCVRDWRAGRDVEEVMTHVVIIVDRELSPHRASDVATPAV